MNWKPVLYVGSALLGASAVVAVLAGPAGPSARGVPPESTETATHEPTTTETPEATATEEAPTATLEPTATEAPTPTATDAAPGDHGTDIAGIPDDNPKFVPDGDGVCEKGESAIKTTPSGKQVNVPCHAAENSTHAQEGHPGHDHGPPDDD